MSRAWFLLTATACGAATVGALTDTDTDASPVVQAVPWSGGLPDAASLAPVRGRVHRRAVMHLHSPFSHDACDGAGYVDGVVDEACAEDLHRSLCETRFDLAFVSDHPDYGDQQPFDALFQPVDGGAWETETGGTRRARVDVCGDGHVVRWFAGFEDELMPLGLSRHVDDDPAVRHDLLNRVDAEAVSAMRDAGASVFVAHSEGRPLALLESLQDAGLHGIEVYNLHAAFAPDIRSEHLGLDALAWVSDMAPFLLSDEAIEPDLYFLAVHQAQAPSEAHLDALLARGPMMVMAGTDAHQNVLPSAMRDGERADSYRRMLRWFSTMLLADDTSLDAALDALDRRRSFVAFEALGTPEGFDLHLQAGDTFYEMGEDAPAGTLTVSCPTLSAGSPRGLQAPEISVVVYKDGEPWQTACGSWPVEEGVYRVRVDMVPHHLADFLGGVADTFMRPYPWIYSGAVRVVR